MRPSSIVRFDRLYLASIAVGLIGNILEWPLTMARLAENPDTAALGSTAAVAAAEEQDDRDDIQKLIDNATDPDTVLVRDPSATPELQEIGILELLQRYPCRGSDARWSPDEAVAFLETKSRWLDAALETWEADGEAMADDSDVIEAKAVVLVVPEKPGQALLSEVLDVLIPVEE